MYRIHEAVMHYAEAIKAIMSEELGAFTAGPALHAPQGVRH